MSRDETAGQPENLTCSREKYWEEMSIEEKLEKAGQVIENLNRRLVDQDKKIGLLSMHSHSSDGSMLVPIKAKEYALEQDRLWSPINRKPR
jgi:hypothetical protein